MAEQKPPSRNFWIPVSPSGRWLAGGLLVITLGLLAVASWLRPDESPQRMGTHVQLGMGPCGFVFYTGLPCPSCGMTTAFSYLVRGRLHDAFLAQPAGLGLALITVLAAAVSLVVVITGQRPAMPAFIWMHPMRTAWLAAGVFFFGWGFKIGYGYLTGILPVR